MTRRFWSRGEAGMLLGRELGRLRGTPGLVVLALPRGGVPVGQRVAKALDAPLDVMTVRRLGLPGYPELAMGALAAGGVRVLDADMVREFNVPPALVERAVAAELAELTRREHAYRGWAPPLDLRGRPVLLVDDALATGATMCAAVRAARERGARSVVVAVPVGSAEACRSLRRAADDVFCLSTPEPFGAAEAWYDQYPRLDDNDVREVLERARRDDAPHAPHAHAPHPRAPHAHLHGNPAEVHHDHPRSQL